MDFEFTEHAYDMLKERNIKREWVELTVNNPLRKLPMNDGTIHFIGQLEEYKSKYLRVVVSVEVESIKITTIFFDRRLRGQDEAKNRS